MKPVASPVVLLAALALVCMTTTRLQAEELGANLEAGPPIGKKIDQFPSKNVTGRHLCWSCFG